MAGRRRLEERVGALERRLDGEVTSGEHTAEHEPAAATAEDLADRLEALEESVAELEAGLEALRGYVGSVEHVNETVERRANAALAAVERLDSAPETPPPIATASREVTEPTAEDSRDTDPGDDASEGADDGLLDRLSALG